MPTRSPIYTEEDDALRNQIVRFSEREILPHGEVWEEAGEFPRELYRKAGDAGILGIGFPEDYGGAGGDVLHYCMVREELCRSGFSDVRVSLMAHGIGLPLVINQGHEAHRRARGPFRGEDHLPGDLRAQRRLRRRQHHHQGDARR